jgi:hemolysin III
MNVTATATASQNPLIVFPSYQQHAQNEDHQYYDSIEHGKDCWWRFTEVGDEGLRERSRDGSRHVTDEVFNSVSHLSALFLSILGSVLLVVQASAQGSPWKIVSFSIYGLSLCFLFAASTLHHSITTTQEWEEFFQTLDYLAIFPLIAGTFTPLCLVLLVNTTVGWTFFSVVWLLGVTSMIVLVKYFVKLPKWLTMTMYVTLGWMGVFLAYFLAPILGDSVIAWMMAGGVWYTVGGIIYTCERPNPLPGKFGFHEIWHLMVILGAASHWFLMYNHVLFYDRHGEEWLAG